MLGHRKASGPQPPIAYLINTEGRAGLFVRLSAPAPQLYVTPNCWKHRSARAGRQLDDVKKRLFIANS